MHGAITSDTQSLIATASGSGTAIPAASRAATAVASARPAHWTATARRSRPTATIPSSQKWLAVAATTKIVSAGCSNASQRQRQVTSQTTTEQTSTAHQTWTDVMSESWSGPTAFSAVYTDWPYFSAVSTKPKLGGSSRGGATGTSCTSRHDAVSSTTVVRTCGYRSRWRRKSHSSNAPSPAKCMVA